MTARERYEACTNALWSFAREAGFTDVVLGLSGGMDSALVACMCVDAMGAEHVHGVMLPGPYTSQASLEDAQEEADALGMHAEVVSILQPFEAFESVLRKACGGRLAGLAAENTQARCRMVCLMALSNAHGWMLVNTGNRSEGYLGYATLYGDMAGAFAPIGGLYKTEVYELARWRNEHAAAAGQTPPIPERVFTKPPSAELAPGQTDEASMGLDYPRLDAILSVLYDEGLSPEAAAEKTGSPLELVEDVKRRSESAAFKRALAPAHPVA